MRRLVLLLCCLTVGVFSLFCGASQAHAGVMTREVLMQKFPSPFIVGERDHELPVWPIYKQNATANELVGYVFESIDFAPVPGFSGVPLDLLIVLDPKGNYIDVQVVSHHEPVFLDGLGEVPLFKFVEQYRGLSLKQNMSIGGSRNHAANDAGNAHLDGIAKATASVRIINQSVLSASLKVARKKLGFSAARDPDRIARIWADLLEPVERARLADVGLLRRFTLSNGEVERAYKGSAGEGIDAEGLARPEDEFIDLQVVWLSVPTVGHSLLSQKDWKRLMSRLEDGDHAILVAWRGRYAAVPDDFVPGSVSSRFIVSQGGLPIEMRDLNLDLDLRDGAPMKGASMKIFRVISQAGLDPSQPLDFSLRVTRLKGIVYPERIDRDFSFSYKLPGRFYVAPESDGKGLLAVLKDRWVELALIAAALVLLFAVLAGWRRLTADARRFAWFRKGYLAFTLLFIGWHAQGQLSIVNLTSVIQALKEGRSLAFLLYDPISLLLWLGVLPTLFIWGRGTFCGWLCPFGALQEFIAMIARRVGVPPFRIRQSVDVRLKRIKYVLLGGIVVSACVSTPLTDRLVELEPFKTAITLMFVRSWPFAAYALALLAVNAIVYKAFCRYLCPFGAGLALFGRVRRLAWLRRRAECGQPCQTCRHRCEYGAIRRNGAIQYDECFQCMECVVVYQSDSQCAPLILEKKHRHTIPIAVDCVGDRIETTSRTTA
jgi:NosR/NirI family transcriptional regulator, nitrous oxide reductase regulator